MLTEIADWLQEKNWNGADLDEYLDRPIIPEPAYLVWCRTHERWLGDIAVLVACAGAAAVLWLVR